MEQNILMMLGAKKRSLIETALCIAQIAHEDQVRKDDDMPYIIHPVMVAIMLAQAASDEKTIAAGLVHDVLEDTAVTEQELMCALGSDIVRLVLPLTEQKTLPWRERKERYIEAVREASDASKWISLADKIHNADCLLTAVAAHGDRVWNLFAAPKEDKIWFERALLTQFQETIEHPFVKRYQHLVEQIEKL